MAVIHKNITGDEAIHPIMYVQSGDPGAVGANKFWLDTTAGANLQSGAILKQRDGSNAAWTTRADLSGFTSGGIPLATFDALGDLLYGSADNTVSKLSGQTTATKKFLRQTGTGSASAAPAWDVVVENDVGASTNNAGNTSTAITIDWSLGRAQKCTATGNFTLTHSNMVAGLVYTLEVLTGAGSFTATFSSTNWAGGTAPTLTVTASKEDIFTFYKNIGGTIVGGIFGQNITP